MRRTRAAAVLLVVGVLCLPAALGACASNDARLADADTPLAKADRLLGAGDYESAVAYFDQALEDAPGSAVVLEKLATARLLAAQSRAARAVDAAAKGNPAEARVHLSKAEIYDISAPVVRRAREQLRGVLAAASQARSLKHDAAKSMESDPLRAQDLLAKARQLDPADAEIVSMLREATLRSEALRAARRAATAWRAGQRSRAVRELARARFAGRSGGAAALIRAEIEADLLRETLPRNRSGAARENGQDVSIPSLRRARELAIEAGLAGTVLRSLRERLAAALQRDATKLLGEGRPAVAALLETECLRLGAPIPTPALDAVAERAQIVIAVAPFDDATHGDVDGLRIARALAARLEADARGGGASFKILSPSSDQARLLAAYPRALRLTGEALSARVAEGPRNTIVKRIALDPGVRIETNPALAVVRAEIRVLAHRRSVAHERAADAWRKVERLKSAPEPSRTADGSIDDQRATHDLALARAQSRVTTFTKREERLAQQEAAAELRAATLPPRRATAAFGVYPLETLEFRKVAEVTVKIRLADGEETLFEASVTGTAQHDEVVAPGLPEIDLAEDPDDTPDDASMSRAAVDHFAVVAAGRVRHAAERAARRFLVDARRAEKSGRAAEAAEAYALYLLSTAEVATARRADAARALHDLVGVRVILRTGVEETE